MRVAAIFWRMRIMKGKVGGKLKKGRREKEIREGRRRTSYTLPLPKTSLKALQQGEIQSLFNLDSTKIIKGKK